MQRVVVDPLTLRVVARYMRAGWTYLNGTYTNIAHSPTKWRVEEMANGEPIPATRGFGEDAPVMHVYELPVLETYARKKSETLNVRLDGEAVRQFTHFHYQDKGPAIRQKILDGTKTLFDEIAKSLREGPDQADRLAIFEKLRPEFERKLVWKKVT
jgi:hypothetical protein